MTDTAIAWLRDLDGTGSLHVCAKGDPGAFPVCRAGAAEAENTKLREALEKISGWRESDFARGLQHSSLAQWFIDNARAALSKGDG